MKTALIAFAAAGLFLTAVLLGAGEPPPTLAPPSTVALKPTPVPGTVPAGEGPAPVAPAPEEPQPASPAPEEPQPAALTGFEGAVAAQAPAATAPSAVALGLEPQAVSGLEAAEEADLAGEVAGDGQVSGDGLTRVFVNIHVVIHEKLQIKEAGATVSHEVSKLTIKVRTKQTGASRQVVSHHMVNQHVVTHHVTTATGKVRAFVRQKLQIHEV